MMPLDSSSSGDEVRAVGAEQIGVKAREHAARAGGDVVGDDAGEVRVLVRVLLDEQVAARVDVEVVGPVQVRGLGPVEQELDRAAAPGLLDVIEGEPP